MSSCVCCLLSVFVALTLVIMLGCFLSSNELKIKKQIRKIKKTKKDTEENNLRVNEHEILNEKKIKEIKGRK